MKRLSRIEEIILLSILKLSDNAYGVSIREQIYKDTGEKLSFASIYPPLDKMKRRGLVKKTKGNPSPERGGKSKYYYQITSAGRQVLIKIHETRQRVWTGAIEILWDSEGNK